MRFSRNDKVTVAPGTFKNNMHGECFVKHHWPEDNMVRVYFKHHGPDHHAYDFTAHAGLLTPGWN